MRTAFVLLLIFSTGCIGELDGNKPAPPPVAIDPPGAPPAVDPGALPPGAFPPGSVPPPVDPAVPAATPPPASPTPATSPPATTPPPVTPPAVTPPGATRPPAAGCAAKGPIPADADLVLRTRCQTCHAARPLPGVQGSLVSSDDFLRPSKLDPSRTVGQLAAARIDDSAARMPPPPGAPLTAAEKAALQGWIGTLQVACPTMPPVVSPPGGGPSTTPPPAATPPAPSTTPPPPPSIFDVPARCTSGRFYRPARGGGDDGEHLVAKGDDSGSGEGGGEGHGGEGGEGGGSPLMNPGRACIACHATNEAPRFAAAGTIYPSAHEPDDCNGTAASAAAVIVDATGKTVTAPANAAGNFFIPRTANLQPPLRAKVTFEGRERIMLRTIPDGDCNACHTQNGAQMSPGRIVLP
jgi:hypothetical protein